MDNGVTFYQTAAASGSGSASNLYGDAINLAVSASVGSNALTFAVKNKLGSDPSVGDNVTVPFRNATEATGTYTTVDITSALSMTVSSGSTLGLRSAVNQWIYVYLINNAGTAELAVSGVIYDNGDIVSTTAEGGAGGADSNRVIYSTTARTNVPITLIARARSNQTTSGTYTSVPNQLALWPFEIDRIAARYELSGATANPSVASLATEIIDFNILKFDTNNAVITGASWSFTAPRAGIYAVAGFAPLDSVADTKPVDHRIYKNGALEAAIGRVMASASDTVGPGGLALILCSAGDTLDLRCFNGDAATRSFNTASNYNHISIWFVGPIVT
jgi:hypothetical protein